VNAGKILGATVALVGIGLIVWAGATSWGNRAKSQADSSEASSSSSVPLRPAEFQAPATPPLEVAVSSRTPKPTPIPINTATPTPLWGNEPLVPTAPPLNLAKLEQTLKPTPASAPSPLPSSSQETRPPQQSETIPLPQTALDRFGVGVPYPPLQAEVAEKLGLGWHLAWRVLEHPSRLSGVAFWQMVRVREDGFYPDKAAIQRASRANPGANWLIGNEPDVIWQDNVTPERYAEWYHELYYLLKKTDPTCRVAIGGVSQPTPLRLQYLDMVMSSYQARYDETMPVDMWNIHNFILREERNSWGVEIPPGLTADQGIVYEVDDHDNLEIFKAQITAFRQWMAKHGERNKPLIVSEYGILMPADYGFDPERVQRFLYGTYQFMLNATGEEIGYPDDNNHLVQRWAWYSLSDDRYPTGNLVDFATGELTSLGKAHQGFVSRLP